MEFSGKSEVAETREEEKVPGDLKANLPAKPNISRKLFNDSSDVERELGDTIPSFSSLFSPARPKISYVEKFLSRSRNASLKKETANNSSMVCEACGLETEYSRDMGIEEDEKFEVSKL